MANQKHLGMLNQGVQIWNQWRKEHTDIRPDLSHANLSNTNLSRVNLSHADLSNADLSFATLSEAEIGGAYLKEASMNGANLYRANLNETNLSNADLSFATLSRCMLSKTNLRETALYGASLYKADLSGADLSGADLRRAILIETNLNNAIITNCAIYGISAWNVSLQETRQENLVITRDDESTITVDNLQIAQFIYLLLDNAEIRAAIDTIARKAVLILGRFTPLRKAILDAIREALRTCGYLPILFDFDKPSSQDVTETVSTLAHLSRFILVDLTDPSSAPYEVGTIASTHIRPIQAIFHPSNEAKRVFAMFPDLLRRYHWVLPPYEYHDQAHLLATLKEQVIEPAEQKALELEKR